MSQQGSFLGVGFFKGPSNIGLFGEGRRVSHVSSAKIHRQLFSKRDIIICILCSKSPMKIVLSRKKNLLHLSCYRNPSQKGLFCRVKKTVYIGIVCTLLKKVSSGFPAKWLLHKKGFFSQQKNFPSVFSATGTLDKKGSFAPTKQQSPLSCLQ